MNLPVSFLCDRDTTNVAKSQPGFCSFIVLPLFVQLAELMPNMKPALDNVKAAKTAWETYEETEEEKKVYDKKFDIEESPLPGDGSSDEDGF